jgi:hypothetical protein
MVTNCSGELSQRLLRSELRRVRDWVGRRSLEGRIGGAGTLVPFITTPDAEMQCSAGNKIAT